MSFQVAAPKNRQNKSELNRLILSTATKIPPLDLALLFATINLAEEDLPWRKVQDSSRNYVMIT